MLHNIDTVGADVDPGMLGLFASKESTLAFEVIPRKIEDVGGGLARVNGMPRLVEGLVCRRDSELCRLHLCARSISYKKLFSTFDIQALPRESDEFNLSYYNSMTTFISISKLLAAFGLERSDLPNAVKVSDAVHAFSRLLPTYVALKEVKKRWGHGQEDVFPTAQFEKLWSDMSSLEEIECQFYVVSRVRGSQLKDVSQLDGWLRDGSAEHLETLCDWC